jgi:hypothetical protein
MTQDKQWYLANVIAGVMLLLCLLIGFSADAQKAGRIWSGSFPPTTPPQGFSTNADIWLDTTSNQSFLWNRAWRLAPVQYSGRKGDKGDKGDTGANGVNGVNGVCPDCPPTSGGSSTNAWEVNTWAGLISALQNDNIRAIDLRADIVAGGKWRIPANYSRIKIINGNGYRITIPSTIDTFIVRSYPSLSAANSGIDMQLRIYNTDFVGSNNICMYLEATYGSEIIGNRFSNFKTAVDARWCMGIVIMHNYCWENYISFNLDYARFTGGSNSASQSNHPYIAHNKYRSSAGHLANVRLIAVSGAVVFHEIDEGIENGPQYHYYFDDNASNVVHGGSWSHIHAENKASIASLFIKSKQGTSDVSDYFGQYDNVIVSFESSAYGKLYLRNFPYLTSGSKFENKNSAGRISIENFPATFTITDATKWAGSIPTFLNTDSWDANGQKRYLQGITIR